MEHEMNAYGLLQGSEQSAVGAEDTQAHHRFQSKLAGVLQPLILICNLSEPSQ